MSDAHKCELCGLPMPPNEIMFKYHGYSGPCPGPPLQPPKAPSERAWRVGRKVGRTIYDHDELVGMMDTPDLARMVVDALNALASLPTEAELAEAIYEDESFTRNVHEMNRTAAAVIAARVALGRGRGHEGP